MKGSGLKEWQHGDKKYYRYKEPEEHYVSLEDEEDDGKFLSHITWSNLRYKTIAEALRDGKSKVKLEFNEVTEELTTHLNSEVLGRKSKTGKWQYDIKLNTPNHFWDCLNMLLVMMDIYEVLKDGGDESKDDSKEDGWVLQR